MNTLLKAAAALALAGATAGTAQAAMITPTSATSASAHELHSVNNLINGSGLSSNSLTATHNRSTADAWLSANGDITPTILFDLGAVYTLSAIHVWQRTTTPAYQVRRFDLLTSLDGDVFTSVLKGASLTQVAQGIAIPAQKIGFDGVGRYVRMAITGNYGNLSYSGLSEIRFESTDLPDAGSPPGSGGPVPGDVAGAVPEPATWAMMLLGFGLLGTAMRRRRAAPRYA